MKNKLMKLKIPSFIILEENEAPGLLISTYFLPKFKDLGTVF